MLSQINKKLNKNIKNRIFMCVSINILLFILLYNLPLETGRTLCLYTNLTGKHCWGCGMTRAFLSIIHLDFKQALVYNWRVSIVFPLVVILYITEWVKYILRRGKYARKI